MNEYDNRPSLPAGCLSPGDPASRLSPGMRSRPQEELPRYHKRAFAHNYHAPFIYHIILKKQDGFEKFGEVKGSARIPYGQPGCAYIEETNIGSVIAKEIKKIQKQYPILQAYQYKVMPDHVHILLNVKEWSDYHLDFYMETLCDNIACTYSRATRRNITADMIFQPGYCDKPLLRNRSLDALYTYIRHNPHRLAMRRQFPDFFQRLREVPIGGKEYAAYGNLFLLRNPDKEAVKVGRHWDLKDILVQKDTWLASVKKGTILVSPFISKPEKDVREAAEDMGAKIILIVHEAFPERYAPAAHDFALCAEVRLLIISLGLPVGTPISYPICTRMNELAKDLAAHPKILY